jgi:hypothetical protein
MTDGSEPRSQTIAQALLYWFVLAACVVLPWVMHFAVGWWAAFPTFFTLVMVYDRLFVPKGSLCMGIPFGLAMGSFLALLLLDVLSLLNWLVGQVS